MYIRYPLIFGSCCGANNCRRRPVDSNDRTSWTNKLGGKKRDISSSPPYIEDPHARAEPGFAERLSGKRLEHVRLHI
jgi:hypothetical protein